MAKFRNRPYAHFQQAEHTLFDQTDCLVFIEIDTRDPTGFRNRVQSKE